MELKLYIQQATVLSKNLQPAFYSGSTPQTLTLIEITARDPFPNDRKFPNYGDWEDVTNDVSDLFKLKLTWTSERDSSGVVAPGASQSKKSASGTLTFEGEAYRLLKQWLVDDVSAPLNSIAVKLWHVGCGNYLEYVIKSADVTWCEDAVCTFDVTLKQQEEQFNCIKRTLINDNHKGWFQKQPDDNKKHPRFSYCNEQRPNGTLVMVWWMAGVIMVPTLLFMMPLMLAMNIVFGIINTIIGIIQTIRKLFGGRVDKVDWETIPYFNFKKMREAMGAYFVESAGCGREHPAPLIRDYIENVCLKCGVTVNAETAPIFFDKQMTIETSSRGKVKLDYNPHYNACYLFAQTEKGIRRYKSLNALRGIPNNTDYFLYDNSPLITLDMFLDELKTIYNADWRLKDGKLYFQRKDWFEKDEYIYDFSKGSSDRFKLLEGICYEWNELKYPAYTKGLYSEDAADRSGANAGRYTNDYVEHGNADDNPNFEGVRDKTAQFGAAKFRLDGADEDYLYDAFQVVVNGSFLTPFFAGLMFDYVGDFIKEYADYGLLLSDDNTTLPKILLWDGQSYNNAKCIRQYSTRSLAGNINPPLINKKYNKEEKKWIDNYHDETFVRGSGLTLPPNQDGYYLLTDFFGAREIKQPAMLVNYNMFFAPGYWDSMWDWFHWIDDPEKNPVINMRWTAKIELCCDDLKEKDSNGKERLNVLEDAANIVLGEKVRLPTQYYGDGRIKEIEVSYDPTDTLGQHIVLKGDV
ncbi:MAG: hypothetical protein R2800_08100 [Flavipsychrobacter sp.]